MRAGFVVSYPTTLKGRTTTLGQTCGWAGTGYINASYSSFRGSPVKRRAAEIYSPVVGVRSVTKAMFSGGGFLGVGPSEVVVIVAVGWLFLGPQKLFSLAKDSGKLIGELRRTADDAKDTFNEAMDMDMLASELEGNPKAKPSPKSEVGVEADGVVSTAVADVAEKVEEKVNLEMSSPDQSDLDTSKSGQNDETLTSAVEPPMVEAPSTEMQSSFLDQLKRVSDPNQVAPSEIPDLDVDRDEEMELQRLEKEYMEAKERLELRRKGRAVDGKKGVGSDSREEQQLGN